MEPTIANGRLQGTTAAEEAVSGIRELATLRNSPATNAEQDRQLDTAIDALAKLLLGRARELDSAGIDRARNRILNPGESAVDRATEQLLQRIADELAAIRANTGRAPSAVGALGSAAAGP